MRYDPRDRLYLCHPWNRKNFSKSRLAHTTFFLGCKRFTAVTALPIHTLPRPLPTSLRSHHPRVQRVGFFRDDDFGDVREFSLQHGLVRLRRAHRVDVYLRRSHEHDDAAVDDRI